MEALLQNNNLQKLELPGKTKGDRLKNLICFSHDKGGLNTDVEFVDHLLKPYVKKVEDGQEKVRMMKTTSPINLSLEELAKFCQRYSIIKLSLFGSILREDFSPQSDIDVLVEFEPEKTPGLAIVTMEDELSKMMKRQVDLRTSADLSHYFRSSVLAEARVIYEQN